VLTTPKYQQLLIQYFQTYLQAVWVPSSPFFKMALEIQSFCTPAVLRDAFFELDFNRTIAGFENDISGLIAQYLEQRVPITVSDLPAGNWSAGLGTPSM